MLFLSAQKTAYIKDPIIYGTDSLMLDLEDAVSVNQKDAARFSMYHAMTSIDYGITEMIVRINGLDTPYWQEDIRACVAAGVDGIRIAKCESAQDVRLIEEHVLAAEKEFGIEEGRTLLIAALETPLGILNAYQVASASERLFGIAISGGDLRRTLQVDNSASGIELLHSRGMVVLAARAANIQCFDTVFTDLSDTEGFEREVRLDKELGFDGKSLINPKQIQAVHQAFTPTAKEIANAEKTVRVLCENRDKGTGVFTVDGKMLDIAFLPGAKRTIALAKACGIYKGDL
ncbi:MAG: aldolase/citrate lyase family protein [Pygmaiobacter sp.]